MSNLAIRKDLMSRALAEARKIDDPSERFAKLYDLLHRLDTKDTIEVADELLSTIDDAPEHLAKGTPLLDLHRYKCRATANLVRHVEPDARDQAIADAIATIDAVPDTLPGVRADMLAFLHDRIPAVD